MELNVTRKLMAVCRVPLFGEQDHRKEEENGSVDMQLAIMGNSSDLSSCVASVCNWPWIPGSRDRLELLCPTSP